MNPTPLPWFVRYIVRAPFFIGFLFLLYLLGCEMSDLIDRFGAALGFSELPRQIASFASSAFFLSIALLVLIRYFSKND